MAQQVNQDFYVIAPSAARAEATYTFDLPVIRAHRGAAVLISNTAESGVSTLDAKLQYKNPQSAAWTDLPGASFVQWADGSTGERFIMLHPNFAGGDADASIALATNFKILGMYALRYLRLSATVGGTSVTRTFSAGVFLLP